MDRNWNIASLLAKDGLSMLQIQIYRNHKTELFYFPLQLIDKHTLTILTRTIEPEEQRNTRLIPRANLGLSKSCQCCQTYLKSILHCDSDITQHRLNPTQPKSYETQMKIGLFQVWVLGRRSLGISALKANSVRAGAL